MEGPGSKRDRRSTWALLASAILLAFCASVSLVYLFWSYVPYHAGQFADLGLELPLSTRYAILASNWCIRLLPLLVLASPLVLGLLAVVLAVAWRRAAFYRALKAVAIAVLLVGTSEVLACAFILYAMRAAYLSAR